MKIKNMARVGLIAIMGAGALGWQSLDKETRGFLAAFPTNTDILFWRTSQRDAAFRALDRLPFLAKHRVVPAGGTPSVLPPGPPLALPLDIDAYMPSRTGIGQPGRGYGYQWWTYDDGSFAARGIFGQGIFIDPARKLVIASNANWGNNATDPTATAAREAFYVAVQQAVDAEVAAAAAKR